MFNFHPLDKATMEANKKIGFMTYIRPYVGNGLDIWDMVQLVQFAVVGAAAFMAANTEGINQEVLQKRLDAFVEYSFQYKNEEDGRIGRKTNIPELVADEAKLVTGCAAIVYSNDSNTEQKKEAMARLIVGDDVVAVKKVLESPHVSQLLGALTYSMNTPDIMSGKTPMDPGPVLALLAGMEWKPEAVEDLAKTFIRKGESGFAQKMAALTTDPGIRKGVPNNDASKGGAARKSQLLNSNQTRV